MTARRDTTTTTQAPPSLRLRTLSVLTALVGVWTLVSAELVEVPVALLTGAVIAASATAATRLRSDAAMRTRKQVAVLVLGLASATALVVNGGSEVSDSTATVLGLLLCAAAGAHALVVDTVRDARVNLAVSVSMLLLAAGLAPGLSIAAPVVLTWCFAVTTLVVASGEAQGADTDVEARVEPTADRAPVPAMWAGIVTTVAVAVLVGIAVALVLPHPPEVRARSSFGNGADQSRNPSSSTSRSATAYLGDGPMDLDSRGRLDDKPIALVSGTVGEHWRAAVLATYDGDRWWPAGREEPLSDISAGLRSVAIPVDQRSPRLDGLPTRTDDVTWVGRVAPVLLSPGVPTSVEFDQAAGLLRAPGRFGMVPFEPDLSYTVTSSVQPDSGQAVARATEDDATDPEWTQLPAALPARVETLARQIAGNAPDRAAAVLAVETYLRQNMTYDLDSPVAPRGRDSVDEFLFTSRSGFCEHFASAEVVLLRSLGIPARVVTGFLSGIDTTDVDGRQQRVLRGSDAHAWVEVWVPGAGWTVSDPTAGATAAGRAGGGFTSLVQELVDTVTGSGVRKVVIAVVLLVGAALLLVAPRRRRRRTAAATQAAPSPNAPLFAAFHRFEQALEEAGQPRDPAESVRALAGRIGRTGIDSADIRRALHVVERASYAAVPPGGDETRDAARAIDEASARLLASTRS